MKIEVGDRVTYKWFDRNLKEMIEKTVIIEENGVSFTADVEILKIERPNWEVVEEKKELLTEEEREFLRQFIKYNSENKKMFMLRKEGHYIFIEYIDEIFGNKDVIDFSIDSKKHYKSLELSKHYTLKELGLEE